MEFVGVADPVAWLRDAYVGTCAGAIVHVQLFVEADMAALGAAVRSVMTSATEGGDGDADDTHKATAATGSSSQQARITSPTVIRCPLASLAVGGTGQVASSDAAAVRLLQMLRGLGFAASSFAAQRYNVCNATPAQEIAGSPASQPFAASDDDGAAAIKGAAAALSADRGSSDGVLPLFLVRRTVSTALRAHTTRSGATEHKYPDTQSRQQFAFMRRYALRCALACFLSFAATGGGGVGCGVWVSYKLVS